MVDADLATAPRPGDAASEYHSRSKWWFEVGPDGAEQILMGIPPDLGQALGEQRPGQ